MDEQTKFSIDLIREIEELKLLHKNSIEEQNSINLEQLKMNVSFGAIFSVLQKILTDKKIVTKEELDQYFSEKNIADYGDEIMKGLKGNGFIN